MGLLSPELSPKHMRVFTNNLARHASGAITISRSLELIAAGQAPRRVRRVSADMADCIRRGATLAQAAHWNQRYLPDFFVAMVDLGERSGHLDHVLTQLAQHYEDKCDIRAAYVAQMVYPFLLILSIVLFVPLLRAFLGSAFIPGWQGPVYVFSRFALTILPWILFAIILFILGRLMPLKRWLLHFAASVWPTRRLSRIFSLITFLQSMAILTSSHLAIGPALRLAARACGRSPLENRLNRAADAVARGHSLHDALAMHAALPPDILIYVEVAEKSGRLEETFQTLARDRYESALYYLRTGAFFVEGAFLVIIVFIYFGAPTLAVGSLARFSTTLF